jgi:hypothetical protein
LDCDTADAPPGAIVQSRSRRFFNYLLVAPLNRALAIEEVQDTAIVIAENLNFDVPWLLDVFLDIEARIAKR